MIWFFLMGMIAGAAGVIMYADYRVRKHRNAVKLPHLNEDKEEKSND